MLKENIELYGRLESQVLEAIVANGGTTEKKSSKGKKAGKSEEIEEILENETNIENEEVAENNED